MPSLRHGMAAVAVVVATLLTATPAEALQAFPDCVKGPLANNTVCDPTAAPAARALALVKAMAMDEKTANLVNSSPGAPRIGLPAYEWWSEALHGVAGSPGVAFNRTASGMNGNGPAPEFGYATSFAGPITLSAAFDDELVERVATVVSTEARAFSNAGRAGLDYWTPNINPYKDPRWGRGAETPGEDPFRIKGYVRALLRGLEGPYVGGGGGGGGRNRTRGRGGSSTTDGAPSRIRKVVATCKHFAAYDLERWQDVVRYGFDAVVSLQDLSEYYLPPFQQCARDSRVGSIMCSYNAVNGTPACASTYLMTDILRKHWGWAEDHQYVTSDCNAILNFHHEHNFTVDAAHSAALAYAAGTDTVCEVPQYGRTDVTGAVADGLLPEAVIDRALARLYEGLVRAGYFDPASASPYRALGWKDVDTPEARALALQSAADGLVLKKNALVVEAAAGDDDDGAAETVSHALLPLDLAGRSVALIGHWADATREMLGGYSGIPPFYHNAVAAARARNVTVHVFGGADGAPVSAPATATDTWTAPALAAAAKADVVLYFGGTDLTVAAEEKDRTAITLPQAQLDLVAALAALGKPTVVVQLGDQTDDTPLLRNANISAVLWAGYPGQAGGDAVLDAITGVTPPAGRLPVTQYPGDYVTAVPMTDMALRPSASSPGRTYRWYRHAVLPFGFGLHYTGFAPAFAAVAGPASGQRRNVTVIAANATYAIGDVLARCSRSRHRDLCRFGNVAVAVTNTGSGGAANVTSDFVALVFASGSYGPAPFPRKTLVAYRRLRGIKTGHVRTAALPLSVGSLARTDEAGNLVLYPGTYTLLLDVPTRSTLTFTLTGNATVLDEFPQPK